MTSPRRTVMVVFRLCVLWNPSGNILILINVLGNAEDSKRSGVSEIGGFIQSLYFHGLHRSSFHASDEHHCLILMNQFLWKFPSQP